MEEFERYISSYKDFPNKGIVFKDVLEIFQHPLLFKKLIKKMSCVEFLLNADAIVSIDARGFLFGSAISFYTSKPLIFARKPGKLPGELITKSYNLEYGESSLSLQKKSVEKFSSFAIVDDLLATGGTVNCVYEMLKGLEKNVSGLIVLVELKEFEARTKLPFGVSSQVVI